MNKRAKPIQLPAVIVRSVSRAAKRENRTPSDLAAEALQWYFRVCTLPEEIPTRAELRAIRRGREAFQRGDYITFDEFRRKETLARGPRRTRAKVS